MLDQNLTNMADIPVPPLDMPETNHEEAKEEDPVTMYNLTDQEV